MRISILGVGYVGAVAAGCLASQGHNVIAVDVRRSKVDALNAGRSPIVETDLEALIADAVAKRTLRATCDVRAAIADTEISMICVGTPTAANGRLELTYVKNVVREIGECLRERSAYHLVVLRSTVLPGTLSGVVRPLLEKTSGKEVGQDFGLCNNPEFLRESTAVWDYFNPPKTVVGAADRRSGDILARLYASLPGPKITTSPAVAEMVKYADNNWHALKVCFGNEIGRLCKSLSIDGHEVMDVFCQDEKLNISRAYLQPGFAFGGSCLPKDVRALVYEARRQDVDTPVLNAILPSNQRQLEAGIECIIAAGNRDVSIMGFAFKAGTDDLRESPMVALIEHLLGKGYRLKVYDPCVVLGRLTGVNREYLFHTVPHIAELMVDSVDEAFHHAKTLVIGNRSPEFAALAGRVTNSQTLIDLVRIPELTRSTQYHGLCW